MTFRSPRDARRAGLALVPQHDMLVDAASVADNLALLDATAPFFESAASRRERHTRLADRFGLELAAPDAIAATLPVGTRQRIEIVGALAGDPAVLMLDEPTAVLSPPETSALFAALRARAAEGRSVVLITHRLDEVFRAADRLTLLARGRRVKTCAVSETTPGEIAALLLGSSEAGELAPPELSPSPATGTGAAPRLALHALRPRGFSAPPVSLALGAGGMLVLVAIDGNGADMLAAAVAGLAPAEGHVSVAGRALPPGPRAFREAGGRFVPADRRSEGLVAGLTLAENLALPSPGRRFFLDRAAMDDRARERIARFGIRAGSARTLAGELSGGNQQKLVLARELEGSPAAVVAIHPTRGLDIGSAADVRARLAAARAAGAAVLAVTSDPDEARLFDAPLRVVRRGVLSEELPSDASVDELARRMTGAA